jgi:hypothetical protein
MIKFLRRIKPSHLSFEIRMYITHQTREITPAVATLTVIARTHNTHAMESLPRRFLTGDGSRFLTADLVAFNTRR